MKKAIKTFGFLKTTAIGGLFFLLPLIVLGALIGQLVPVIRMVTNLLSEQFPSFTASNAAFLIGVAIAIIISACFVAGVLARRSVGKRISSLFEKNISMLFPRYTIIKEQMRGSIGGASQKPNMKPVFVQLQDHRRIGFEIERINEQLVAVYLPGAPDAWAGNLIYVEPSQIERVDAEFWDTVLVFGELGRGSKTLLADSP
ncbi:MAG: hypothetical protein P8J91_10115 [Pirellulaceae bacterium]|nr:hypothetical protein [Pirellulaceae bacterium]MDG2104095.1 hypothetical protein [Pirellulaceae bacterium]